MKKKILSICLVVAMLVGVLSCGFMLSGTAGVAQSSCTVDAIPMGDVATSTEKISATVATNTNLLAGVTPTFASTPATLHNISNSAVLTDGQLPGINYTEDDMTTEDHKVFWPVADSAYIMYDLGEAKTINSMLIVGSYSDRFSQYNTKLGVVHVYTASEETTADELMASEDNLLVTTESLDFAATLAMTVPVNARYVLFKFDGVDGYARLNELAVYSKAGAAKPVAPNGKEYDITFINGPEDKVKLPEDPNWLQLAGITNPTVHDTVPLKASDVKPKVEGGDPTVIADGDIPGINSENPSSKNKVYWQIASNGDILLFDYGETLEKINRVMVAGSYHEFVDYKSATGDVTVYLGNDMSTLISDENCYGTIPDVNVAGMITLSEAVDARYVAIKCSGYKGYVRISEVGVYSAIPMPGVSAPNEFTGTTEDGSAITVKVQKTMADLSDATFLNSIKGVRLVKKALPAKAPTTIDNGLLRVADKNLYTLELFDQKGDVVTTEEPHMILVTFPNLNSDMNTMGIYSNGTITRVWNAQPTKDRKTMLLGTDAGNKGSVYYTGSVDLVFLTANDPDQVRKENGQQANRGYSLSYNDGKPVVKY